MSRMEYFRFLLSILVRLQRGCSLSTDSRLSSLECYTLMHDLDEVLRIEYSLFEEAIFGGVSYAELVAREYDRLERAESIPF